MYRNGFWNGLTAINYQEHYTDVWWVAVEIENTRISELYKREDFRRNFLISIDYFEKALNLLVDIPETLEFPSYGGAIRISYSISEEEEEYLSRVKSAGDLLHIYYNKNTLYRINNKIITLTKAESEVLSLSAQGHSGHEIARIRGASIKTIDNQLSSIKQKTGLSLRSALCKLYYDQFGALLK